MINKKENTLLIIKNFCNAFYVERDIEKSLTYLSQELAWTGPNKKTVITNHEKVKAIFYVDISLINSSFILKEISNTTFKITDNVYNINYIFKLSNVANNLELHLSLYATIVYKKNVGKINSIKFEYLDKPDFQTNYTIQHSQGGLIVANFINKDFLSVELINEQFSSIFKLDEEEQKNFISKNLFDYIYKDDLHLVKQTLFINFNTSLPFSCNFRVKRNNSYIWIVTIVTKNKQNGVEKFYIMARPTESSEVANKQIENLKSTKDIEKISISGTHRNLLDDKLTIEDISSEFCNLLNYSKKDLIKFTHRNFTKLIHKEDIEYVLKTYNKLKTNRPKKYLVYRLINKKGNSVWIKENISISKSNEEATHTYSIVEELKYLNSNNSANLNNGNYNKNTIKSKFVVIDLVNNKFETTAFENTQIKFVNKYVQDLPNSLIEKNIIYKDDVKSFLDFYNNSLKTHKNIWNGRINLKNNKIGWFQILSYTLFNNKMPIKALCTIISIENQKLLFSKFNKYQDLIKLIISEFEFLAEYDLLENKPIFMYSPKEPKDFYENNKTCNLDFLNDKIIHHDYVQQLFQLKNDNLNYALNGILPQDHEIEIRYRSITNRFEGYQWGKFKFIYKFDEQSKHLHLLILMKNINEKKKNELMLLNNITKNN